MNIKQPLAHRCPKGAPWLLVALLAASPAATAGGVAPRGAVNAQGPARSGRLDAVRQRAAIVARRITDLELRLADLNARSLALGSAAVSASRRIGVLELGRRRIEDRLEDAGDGYVGHAVAIYKQGPSGDLALLLSARSLTELETVAQATSVRAEASVRALERLRRARHELEATRGRLEDRKQALLEARAEAAEVSAETAALLETRRTTLTELTDKVGELEASLRRQDAAARRKAGGEEAGGEEAGGEEAGGEEAGGEEAGRGEEAAPVPAAGGLSSGGADRFIGTGIGFEGIASWYGPGFGGRTTASGNIFRRGGHTAASRDLPLGTWLRVTYQGSEVFVEVNDRGPYIEDRILDLSEGAARAIGLTGLGWIKAEIVLPR